MGDTRDRDGVDAGLVYDTTSGVMHHVNSTSGAIGLYTIHLGT